MPFWRRTRVPGPNPDVYWAALFFIVGNSVSIRLERVLSRLENPYVSF